jgi:four helix bundle protein
MSVQSFTDLTVWEKSHQIVLKIYLLTKKFPVEERFGLAQLRRSAASICANLAEGYPKTTREYLRYIEISRGSLEETLFLPAI